MTEIDSREPEASVSESVEAEERPLVTFAVFAYNQERYIREAVEAAFSQTYEPLEIILSDDCSSDRTFEIMEKLASVYHGPHQVRVRRNSINLMTALHVQTVANEMAGCILVVAAGDDISRSERVARIVETWVAAGRPAGVVHSGWETFRDEDGALLRRRAAKRSSDSEAIIRGYARSEWLPAAAPTAAYTRSLFEGFNPLPGGSVIEDAPLMLRAAIIGRFVSCDDPLVRVRLHDENTGTGYSIHRPARWNRFLQSKIIAFRTMQSDLEQKGDTLDTVLRRAIERQILKVLRSASGLMIPQCAPMSRIARIRLAARMILSPAVSPLPRVRVIYALSFFGYVFHEKLRAYILRVFGRDGLKFSRETQA